MPEIVRTGKAHGLDDGDTRDRKTEGELDAEPYAAKLVIAEYMRVITANCTLDASNVLVGHAMAD